MLEWINCPFCGKKEAFFVNGGAIYRDGPKYRARLRLACMECNGEFAYIEEDRDMKILPIHKPPQPYAEQTISIRRV